MKILMVSSYLPYPLYSGGNVRLYNLLKFLSKKHEITLVCEIRPYQTERDIKEVEKVCHKVITVERKKQWSAKNILLTGFSLNPFLITGHTSKKMTRIITEELTKKKYNLIHVETFYVMQNLPVVSIPVVLVEHNIEYLVYKRYTDRAPFFARPLLYADVLKLKRQEEYFWERATRLVSVSNAEKALMKRKDVDVVPNGVDLGKFKFMSVEEKFLNPEKRLLFMGDFKWIQNRDCVSYIIKEIWPKIASSKKVKTENLNIKLWIVGKNMGEAVKGLTDDKRVFFDDKNEDETEDIYNKSFMLLAPIRVGGGTSYKILEAMATGTAVVTSVLGTEGLDIRDKSEVLASDNTKDIVESAVNLLADKGEYARLTGNARKFVEKNYDWNIITKELEKVYASCLSQ